MAKPVPIRIAVRVFPDLVDEEKRARSWKRPRAMMLFDTETRIEPNQRLTFGSYRFVVEGECLEEGLFYADDLPAVDIEILKHYQATHKSDTAVEGFQQLSLLTQRDFLEKLYWAVYKGRALLVGFNLPFDLSRVAYDFTDARGSFEGGFSLGIWSYVDEMGNKQRTQYRPRIAIKHIDSKRAIKGFTARKKPDDTDLIPDDSSSGKPEKGYKFRGHFLDLRTLAFALTDRGYSLESACEAFGVEHGKQRPRSHGIVREDYIDYNRRDVLATWELANKLLEEYDRHPISLQPTKAYSPASIGKAYLRAMGIKPILERQRKFPKKYLGYAQSAFFGGRTSAHVRKIPVPVVYTDFLSMYPTVNTLMGLWRFVIAQEIRVIERCQIEIEAFLRQLKVDDLFHRETWKNLTGFVQVIPEGDILPCRGKYNLEANDWQVATNHLYANGNDSSQALWFSLPDVVASVILNRRVPKIVDAFRIQPFGIMDDLKSTKLRGTVEIDPRIRDFFKVVIEERKEVPLRSDLSTEEKKRLDKALKVLANAASYGIYAEMNPKESEDKVKVTCYGIDPTPFTCRVAHPDVPGEYCFPPLASLITGAARLMLALLENQVVLKLGGTYAMEDTDSMAIVANEKGDVIPVPGGRQRMLDGGRPAIKALSWAQVDEISKKFAKLNPYEGTAGKGSILKIEDDNYDPRTGNQRQIYCFTISAKRYALFLRDDTCSPVLLRNGANNKEDRWSEHGLGHLLNPSDPEDEDREWVAQAWLTLIRGSLGLNTDIPKFARLPAIGRITISSPAVIKPFESFNDGKKYCDQLKPFNFLLTCHVRKFGHPIGIDPATFHLIGPFNPDPRQWLKMIWIDQYSGTNYRITTDGHHGSRQTARVKTYGEALLEYEFHPESKCADGNGNSSGKQSVGLLKRRHIEIDLIKYIGKESNHLEQVESGVIHSEQNVYTEYPDPRRDEWQMKIVPVLQGTPLSKLIKITGKSRRTLIDARTGKRRPHPRNQELIASAITLD